MWYFSVSQSRAATNGVPLSVTISSNPPHLQRISSNINVPRVRAISVHSIQNSGHAESEHWACTIYEYP